MKTTFLCKELTEIIISYLNITDTNTFLQTNKLFRQVFKTTIEIIQSTKTGTIYSLSDLLKYAYKNHPNWLVSWEVAKNTSTLTNSIIYFTDWIQLRGCPYHFPRLNMKGVCEILSSTPNLKLKHALYCASYYGVVDVVQVLLSKINPACNDNEAIRTASLQGQTEVVRLLLQDVRVDPSVWLNMCIQQACKRGHLGVVRLLLSDERVDCLYIIRIASQNGHLDIVRLLLDDPRVDPCACDNHALRVAIEYGHLEVVRLLLDDERVVPEESILTDGIQQATKSGNLEVARLLSS